MSFIESQQTWGERTPAPQGSELLDILINRVGTHSLSDPPLEVWVLVRDNYLISSVESHTNPWSCVSSVK